MYVVEYCPWASPEPKWYVWALYETAYSAEWAYAIMSAHAYARVRQVAITPRLAA